MKRTAKDFKFWKNAKRTKFRSVETTIDGYKFASKKEARRFQELKLLRTAGKISDLALQVPFDLVVNDKKICKYVADFCYLENGSRIVEDVKSEFTAKNPVYRLKKKLMLAVHGIEIREVL